MYSGATALEILFSFEEFNHFEKLIVLTSFSIIYSYIYIYKSVALDKNMNESHIYDFFFKLFVKHVNPLP